MHLEISIRPDPIRLRDNYGDKFPKGFNLDAEVRVRKLKNETFTCTCFDDVQKWSDHNNNRIWKHDGAHWYCIYISDSDHEPTYWEMPRGVMNLEDRLWKAIEVYATFYHGIP
jgi:hypothetical protein